MLKSSIANGTLSKLRHFAPSKASLLLYYSSFLFAHITRLSSLVLLERNQYRSDKLQKPCIRIVSFSDFNSHTNNLFAKLKLLKAKHAFTPNRLIFMFDYIKGCIPYELKRLFTFNCDMHSCRTCSSVILHIPKGIGARYYINI